MTDTVVVQGEPEPAPDVAVAVLAGETAAEVEHVAEAVEELEVEVAEAQSVADVALEVAVEGSRVDEIIMQNQRTIIEQNEAIMAGLQLIAEAIDNQPEPEPVPEPKPPKKDTAPKRKSGAHRFLYGG